LTVSTGESQELPMKKLNLWFCMDFSPDGKYIVYDTPVPEDKGRQDIMIYAIDGSKHELLIDNPTDERFLGWVPGSNRILFLSDRDGTWDAWTVSVIDAKTTGAPERVMQEMGQVRRVDFTSDGSFYYINNSRVYSTFIASLSDEKPSEITSESLSPLIGSISNPEYSPSGQYLAYIKGFKLTGSPGGFTTLKICIRDNTTDTEKELPRKMLHWYPVWSPDEKGIFIIGNDRKLYGRNDYNGGIYKIDIESGEYQNVLLFPKFDQDKISTSWSDSRMECSKDMSCIYYLFGDQLIKRDLENGLETVLVNNSDMVRFLDLSPDGKHLLYGVNIPADKSCKLFNVPIEGGQSNEIFSTSGNEVIDPARWSPDGKYIYFNKLERSGEKGLSIWAITRDGKNPQQIWYDSQQAQGTSYYAGNYGLSIHPDGKEIAIYTFRSEVEFWRMSNYLNRD
jgi:Tol biopolymer transport system component